VNQLRALIRNVCPQVFMTLAVLAVFIRVAVPSGYMIQASAEGHGAEIVICTGQGAMIIKADASPGDGHDDKAPASKNLHQSACAFASSAAAAPVPDLTSGLAIAFAAYEPVLTALTLDLRPGKGLTAPPLPARGPPIQSI